MRITSLSTGFSPRKDVNMNSTPTNKALEFVLSETYINDGFECIRCCCNGTSDKLYKAALSEILEWFYGKRNYIGTLDRQVCACSTIKFIITYWLFNSQILTTAVEIHNMASGIGEVTCERCTCLHSIASVKPHVLSEMISSKNQFLTKSKLRRNEARTDMINLARIYVTRIGLCNSTWALELLKSMIPLEQPGIAVLKKPRHQYQ